MTKRAWTVLAVGLMVTGSASPLLGARKVIERIIARVNTEIITQRQFERERDKVRQQMSHQGMDLQVSQDVRELLAHEGYDPQFGARPLRRAVQRLIEDPLSEEILLGRFVSSDTIHAELEDGKIFYTKSADLQAIAVETQT